MRELHVHGTERSNATTGVDVTRNIAHDDRCVLTTDNALEPVIVEGRAERIEDMTGIRRFAAAVNAKYKTSYGIDFFDPAVNGAWRVRPAWAFALMESDFSGSPTRWRFDQD